MSPTVPNKALVLGLEPRRVAGGGLVWVPCDDVGRLEVGVECTSVLAEGMFPTGSGRRQLSNPSTAFQRVELDSVEAVPGTAPVDHVGLDEADDARASAFA
jgi:hypothetical protein